WDALSGQFNVKPLLALNTGCQMGGWSTREIASPEAFKGLRYRMPGLGAEVLRRMGAIVLKIPGGELVTDAQVRRHRRQRMGRPLARHGLGPAHGRPLLLLSRLP